MSQVQVCRNELSVLKAKQKALEAEYCHFAARQNMTEGDARAKIRNARLAASKDQRLQAIRTNHIAIASKTSAITSTLDRLQKELQDAIDILANTNHLIRAGNELNVDVCTRHVAALEITVHKVIAEGIEENSPVVIAARKALDKTNVIADSVQSRFIIALHTHI